MSTILYSHSACEAHDTGGHHPEAPARLGAVLAALDNEMFTGLDRRDAPEADTKVIETTHPAAHISRTLDKVPATGHAHIDGDTVVSPGSREAALRAAGAVTAAVDAVADGEARNAFCAVRPPGHHAEPEHAMGFCLFNNIAVGARHAQKAHGAKRVAVIDFDVHHGNGTQASFWDYDSLFYASSHQYPWYPGTGAAHEKGKGNIVNLPLQAGAASAEFRAGMTATVLPALDAFKPDFVLISAGFDAHREDPLAQLNLEDDDYDWITRELMQIAEKHAGGRVVSVLEGGYNLAALGRSAAAHVGALQAG